MVTTFSNYFFNLDVTIDVAMSSNHQMANNDIDIINQVIEGDPTAFGILVNSYKDLVFTLALRMLKHREEAEEVSQDTFIKVYKSLKTFKNDSKFSTWIYRITYNTCLDRLKKNKKEFLNVPIDEFSESALTTLDNALNMMVANERIHAIQKCLECLPSEDSALLTLYYFEDLSLDEIAVVVNLTANNVKVKLFRSRKKLASILRARCEPELIQYYERDER